jgi:hypothetical protein
MFTRATRTSGAGLALVALTLAYVSAQPPKKAPGDLSEERFKTESFTAFPDIAPPPVEPQGEKLFKQLFAGFPRPIPDGATPLTKVRIAQANEGAVFAFKAYQLLICGNWAPGNFQEFAQVTAEAYRVAAELEATPAGKVAVFEDWVASLKGVERTIDARVDAGTDAPQRRNQARFWRLQAEAELLLLRERLKVK